MQQSSTPPPRPRLLERRHPKRDAWACMPPSETPTSKRRRTRTPPQPPRAPLEVAVVHTRGGEGCTVVPAGGGLFRGERNRPGRRNPFANVVLRFSTKSKPNQTKDHQLKSIQIKSTPAISRTNRTQTNPHLNQTQPRKKKEDPNQSKPTNPASPNKTHISSAPGSTIDTTASSFRRATVRAHK